VTSIVERGQTRAHIETKSVLGSEGSEKQELAITNIIEVFMQLPDDILAEYAEKHPVT